MKKVNYFILVILLLLISIFTENVYAKVVYTVGGGGGIFFTDEGLSSETNARYFLLGQHWVLVVVVDKELNIVELNKRFVDIFEEYPEGFLDAEGLRSFRGSPVSMFVPFAEKFREQFYMSKPAQYRFKHEGKIMRITFFLVETKTLLGAMFEDITTPVIRREAVIEKAEDVITRSLNTVQQIASLLGENAAETEIVLNSIIDEFNVHGDKSADYGLVEDEGGGDDDE